MADFPQFPALFTSHHSRPVSITKNWFLLFLCLDLWEQFIIGQSLRTALLLEVFFNSILINTCEILLFDMRKFAGLFFGLVVTFFLCRVEAARRKLPFDNKPLTNFPKRGEKFIKSNPQEISKSSSKVLESKRISRGMYQPLCFDQQWTTIVIN